MEVNSCLNGWERVTLLTNTIDGGWWSEAASLIKKYGLVPQSLYPDRRNSSNTSNLGHVLASKVYPCLFLERSGSLMMFMQRREYMLELREIYAQFKTHDQATKEDVSGQWKFQAIAACRRRKKQQMYEIYSILAMVLGKPPTAKQALTLDVYDKKNKHKCLTMSPLEIYHSLAPDFVVDEFVMVAHDPRHPVNTAYTVQRGSTVLDFNQSKYLNVDIDTIEDLIVATLKTDRAIWCVRSLIYFGANDVNHRLCFQDGMRCGRLFR